MRDIALLAAIEGFNVISHFWLYPKKDIRETLEGLKQKLNYD
jgi:hypothetical protein